MNARDGGFRTLFCETLKVIFNVRVVNVQAQLSHTQRLLLNTKEGGGGVGLGGRGGGGHGQTRQDKTRQETGRQETKRQETERQKTERQVREIHVVLHPSTSIPKTQKYVSPAAASWPGGSTSALFGIEAEGGGAPYP